MSSSSAAIVCSSHKRTNITLGLVDSRLRLLDVSCDNYIFHCTPEYASVIGITGLYGNNGP